MRSESTSVPRGWAWLSALRSQSPPPVGDVTGIHAARTLSLKPILTLKQGRIIETYIFHVLFRMTYCNLKKTIHYAILFLLET